MDSSTLETRLRRLLANHGRKRRMIGMLVSYAMAYQYMPTNELRLDLYNKWENELCKLKNKNLN